MNNAWRITYEIFPLKSLHNDVVYSDTKEEAIKTIENLNIHKIIIKSVKKVAAY